MQYIITSNANCIRFYKVIGISYVIIIMIMAVLCVVCDVRCLHLLIYFVDVWSMYVLCAEITSDIDRTLSWCNFPIHSNRFIHNI